MKRILLSCMIAATVAAYANAQQIAVVPPLVSTVNPIIYNDLNIAISKAVPGSTIYLPSGGFIVADTIKITKPLTIIGVGYKPSNAGGTTTISGDLVFEGGSDGSAVMGVYMYGDVNIGTAENAVNNFTLRYCNVNSVQVYNNNCQGVWINQNYLRGFSRGGNSPVSFSNNILLHINSVKSGVINHNVIWGRIGWDNYNVVTDCLIKNNICFLDYGNNSTTNCIYDSNMATWAVGGDNTNAVVVESWDNVFEGAHSGVNPNDNYALKSGAPGKGKATDGSDIGIYGDTGFNEPPLPPIPNIISKKIGEKTDANGYLPVQITISAQ